MLGLGARVSGLFIFSFDDCLKLYLRDRSSNKRHIIVIFNKHCISASGNTDAELFRKNLDNILKKDFRQ